MRCPESFKRGIWSHLHTGKLRLVSLVGLAKNHTFNDNSELECNFTQKYSFHLSKFENTYNK